MIGALTMSDLRGFSYTTVKAIQAADARLVGVQLGRICVDRSIPAATIAEMLGVSRQTVYSWFTGRFSPTTEKAERIQALILDFTKVRV